MRCPHCEWDCERTEPPEPEEHDVRFKGHYINVTKDSLSTNWYIRVTHPNGAKLYDGWWRDSENAKRQMARGCRGSEAWCNAHEIKRRRPRSAGEQVMDNMNVIAGWMIVMRVCEDAQKKEAE